MNLGSHPGGRRFLVLGDLLELGSFSREIHREIGREVVTGGRFAGLIAVGAESHEAAQGAEDALSGKAGEPPFLVKRLEGVTEVTDCLAGLLGPQDLVLFKASRAVGLDRAVEETRDYLGGVQPSGENRSGKNKKYKPDDATAGGGRGACSTISIT